MAIRMEKISIPSIEISPSGNGEMKSLPSIRSPPNRARILVTDTDGNTEPYLSSPLSRNRSNSVGSDIGLQYESFKRVRTAADMFSAIIPNSANASYTDGKHEIDKAYAMMRALRRENEEYHKELISERELNVVHQLRIKELELQINSTAREKQMVGDSLSKAEEKVRSLEKQLAEERSHSKQQLNGLLNREKNVQEELSKVIKTTDVLNSHMNILLNRVSFKDMSNDQKRNDEIQPPLGKITLVFTDVENSTEKWEKNSQMMQECLILHNNLIRDKIKLFKGYEVKTEGDSFMIAFSSSISAIRFAMDVQLELLQIPWPSVSLK